MNRTKRLGMACVVVLLGMALQAVRADEAAPAAAAVEPGAVAGRVTAGGSFGEDREVYSLDAMFPVLRSPSSVLLLNPRGVSVADEDQEVNVGLVARHLLQGGAVILGINAYYDAAETEAENTFQQVGGGVEMLSRWVDARANYYHPVTDAEWMDAAVEEALEGFDGEVGVWLPYFSKLVPTAVYAGYYSFESDEAKEDVDGFKVRLESRLHPNVTLDADWYDDKDYAGAEYYVGVRLHMPLDCWNGVRMHRGAGYVPPFAARMLDPVHRDVRVRVVASERVPEALPAPVRKSVEYRIYATLDENGEVIYVRVPK